MITIGTYNYKFEDEAKFLLHYYHKRLDLLGEHHLDELYAEEGFISGSMWSTTIERTLVVDLTIAIDIGFTNHLVDFRVGELLTCRQY